MSKRVGTVALLFLLLFCSRLLAQQGARLEARIRDEKGSSLPGVTVSIKAVGCDCKSCRDPEKCECCPDERVSVSDADGRVQFLVPEGRYSITASLEGFATASQQVEVASGANLSVEIKLSSSSLKVKG
jgi:hypothetical protein